MAARLKIRAAEIHIDQPFSRYGLDSLAAVEITGDLEEWLGTKVRSPKRGNIQRGKPQDEAREFITDFILAHVPIVNGDFKPKIMYLAIMARRVLMAKKDPKLVDDRDYVGNKRLELYVPVIQIN